MGFGLTKEHHDFFHKNHFIEFDDLLSAKEVDSLEKAIDSSISSEEWIHAGHDLWRNETRIQKVTLHKGFAEIASNLCKKKPLRLAYDQAIEGPLSKEPLNLIEASSIRKVVCGLVIQLEPTSAEEEPLVPKKRGSGVFFSPFCTLNFPANCHLFMIAYTERVAQYILEIRDPNRHALKKLGYGFGDCLRTDTHPILFQS